MSVQVFDSEGYAVAFADDDDVIESEALCNGPDYSEDPADWPEWTDQDRWEPTPDDEAWYTRQTCDDDEWQGDAEWSRRLEEMHQASEWQDRLEAMHWSDGDQAVADAGLPVG